MLKRDETFFNKPKWLLKDNKKTVGAWLQLASPLTAEIFGKAGFDWALIDMEHAPGDIMTLVSQCQALNAYNVVPFVRTPWNDFVTIKRVLDAGAYGILVPQVGTAEEAKKAVAAVKYPPQGIRGIAPSPRAGGFGMNGKDYLEHANEQTLVMIAAESPEAISNIEEIVAVEGLDGVFIGPMDLATSMGYFCNPSQKEVQDAIAVVEKTVLNSGKFLGTVAGSIEQALSLYEKGYNLVVVMSDSVSLGKLALENIQIFNNSYPNR
ncbi:HpcH/HpaI aldolase/citrate lyase family protein [Ammoniphilus sp. CFH 90114]|uniref:HpcH/HpaI aldolase family protein n=1 Tax=Ammoniphilus sp. CFH 90114 TaxID=2493665 RepID=UPI00100F3842|nr:aldolase/citrate lyase family protein [Ammoniphilus sp. CFH 90114]RXT05283.1 2,4-dihydroxyhept-2-ene-1,7-dioic acid aldolase [Ammoniphilus sp. CFH 90114]